MNKIKILVTNLNSSNCNSRRFSIKSQLTFCRTKSNMNTSEYLTYQASIEKLNVLQNVPTIKLTDSKDLIKYRLINTMNMCKKLNITEDEINKLNVIHITGTKGKGSTCAFTESILRNYGYKTGLFSSPHLIEVKERIKIDGKSLSYPKFQKYLDFCYEILFDKWNENCEFDRPTYFQLLTCMMLYVFVKEKVDVAIVEVGIGGTYDYTNIVPKPVACGIASLGLDHCSLLGNSLEEIAWQKSGIIKPSCVAFTIEHDSKSALDVIVQRAKELDAPLCLIPVVDKYYDINSNELNLGINGKVQYINSALALHICNYWISKQKSKNLNKYEWIKQNCHPDISTDKLSFLKPISHLDMPQTTGLVSCKWPGRNQILKSANESITYYLDGAHTIESISQFIDWFIELKQNENLTNEKNVLLFTYTGERDASKFLEILMKVKYDSVAFARLNAFPSNFLNGSDNVRKMPYASLDTDEKYQSLLLTCAKLYTDKHQQSYDNSNFKVFENVLDSLDWLTESSDPILNAQITCQKPAPLIENLDQYLTGLNQTGSKINVLITGSLYLVGLSLKVLNYKTS